MTDQTLPSLFYERLRDIVPADAYDRCLHSFSEASMVGVRVNTLKTTREDVFDSLQRLAIPFERLSWYGDAFVVPATARAHLLESALFSNHEIYLQNLSSMLPPLALEPTAEDWVLDLTAAPGSKTLQLACLMNNEGKISAVEAVKPRFFRLLNNIKEQGACNVTPYLKDGMRVGKLCPERFDKVLLDAPCSSEARFRLDDSASFAYWSEKKIRDMQRKQKKLLFSAIAALKPGGRLVYSTCSFAPEENEAVVDAALQQFEGSIAVLPIAETAEHNGFHAFCRIADNVQSGLSQWRDRVFHQSVQYAVRILPTIKMSAFFLCMLQKKA